MKTTIKPQFYCLLYDIDSHTQKTGVLVDVQIIPKKGKPKTTQIPTSSEETVDDLLLYIKEKMGLEKTDINHLIIFGCEEKPKKK